MNLDLDVRLGYYPKVKINKPHLYRHFIGVMPSDDVDEILEYLKDVTESTSTLTTYLQSDLPATFEADVGVEPTYIYFVVHGEISSIMSEDSAVSFDFIGSKTFIDSKNYSYSVNIYRTSDKVEGNVSYTIG